MRNKLIKVVEEIALVGIAGLILFEGTKYAVHSFASNKLDAVTAEAVQYEVFSGNYNPEKLKELNKEAQKWSSLRSKFKPFLTYH